MVIFFVFRLNFFKDVPNFRVLCCGGDGTVGWLLEAMGQYSAHCLLKRSPGCAPVHSVVKMSTSCSH